MNFLAHLYLSGSNKQIIIGNFVADHIVGNKYKHFPNEIQEGIILHRKIDSFTDSHEIVKRSKRRLSNKYGHYNGVIIDIFYDYFLAKYWKDYSAIPLNVFTKSIYRLLEENNDLLPLKTKRILPYVKQYDWLYNYQFLDGIHDVLRGMNKRTKGRSKMDLAIEDLRNLEKEFYNDFSAFFSELILYCSIEIERLK